LASDKQASNIVLLDVHSLCGFADSGWLLLDYGDVIVHIFSAEEREFYQLDEFWHEAVTVLRIQ
jgi:ribosomal silencing factor RsfS